ncbi:GTPase Era [candidate division TA06 bacterium]|uniref:GTPase Era n=1 Tax=candidate division TA06 bacterium TaxID=2250710 RepID=A0A523UR27_UNCT6|nr:MAG: GTPase Era [candidate division TA06 bacterium]
MENSRLEKLIPDSGSQFRAGYVALLGKPNVGKSTLLNALMKQKLAIVTPKPQTTRHTTIAILNGKNFQAILMDTPGIFQPKKGVRLQQSMVRKAISALNDADVLVLMAEPDISSEKDLPIREIRKTDKPVVLTINKIDTVSKKVLLPAIDAARRMYDFQEIVLISALRADGLDELLDSIMRLLPFGSPFYPPDVLTDKPERFFVGEIIRETIFVCYGQEIPYTTTVTVEDFSERDKGKDFIRAVIHTERSSQKAILIGRKGEALKRIGEKARKEIEEFLGRPVYLELWVKTRKDWRKKASDLKEFGY